jgi:hypothetical protein
LRAHQARPYVQRDHLPASGIPETVIEATLEMIADADPE